jgi:ompA family protein
VLRTTYGMFDKDGKLKKEAEKIQQKKENETPDIYF